MNQNKRYADQYYPSKPELDEELTKEDWERIERIVAAQELEDQGDENEY